MLRLTRSRSSRPVAGKLRPAEPAAQGQLAVPNMADRAVGGGQGMRLDAAPAAAASPAPDSGGPSHADPSSPGSRRGIERRSRAEALSRSQALSESGGFCPRDLNPCVRGARPTNCACR
jgi:hypothetical protein